MKFKKSNEEIVFRNIDSKFQLQNKSTPMKDVLIRILIILLKAAPVGRHSPELTSITYISINFVQEYSRSLAEQ